jgi:hypothetical protein
MISRALTRRLNYGHGFPFVTSIFLAAVTTCWPLVREARFHKGTSIWIFAILTIVATAFALLCGGRFCTFYVSIAVAPPFLIALPWFLRSAIRYPDYPIKGFVEYFIYFVAAPIILTHFAATLFNRKEPSA